MRKGRDLLNSLRSGGEVSRERIYYETAWPVLTERIPPSEHKRAADALSIHPAAPRATSIVETRDRPFFDGIPIVRLETHHWRKRRQATKSAMRFDKVKNWRDLYRRWERFRDMADLQFGPAVKSHSFGAFQIMGFNHHLCGFESPFAFLEAMKTVEGQVTAFIRFVQANPPLHRAMAEQDAHAVGLHYNGRNYRKNNYHAKWAAALEASYAVVT